MDDAPWYLSASMPALLRHARATYGEAMRRALEAAGFDDLPTNGLYVIGAIALAKEPLSTKDIAYSLRLDRDAAQALLGALARAGYIRIGGGDPRILRLTERGEQAAARQGQARDGIDAALEQQLGHACLAETRLALATLIDMGRTDGPA